MQHSDVQNFPAQRIGVSQDRTTGTRRCAMAKHRGGNPQLSVVSQRRSRLTVARGANLKRMNPQCPAAIACGAVVKRGGGDGQVAAVRRHSPTKAGGVGVVKMAALYINLCHIVCLNNTTVRVCVAARK